MPCADVGFGSAPWISRSRQWRLPKTLYCLLPTLVIFGRFLVCDLKIGWRIDYMKLGFVSGVFWDLTLEEVFSFASAEGFDCVEVMCWPKGSPRGATHIDV